MKLIHLQTPLLCLLCCEVFLVYVYGASASEASNLQEESKQLTSKYDDTFQAKEALFEIDDKIEEFDEKSSIREARNKEINISTNNSEMEAKSKVEKPVAEPRILLIDDGIQDDKNLQVIDAAKDDLTWRLKGTSFLQDLAREVFGISYQNYNTPVHKLPELVKNDEEEKDGTTKTNSEVLTKKKNSQLEKYTDDEAESNEALAKDYEDESNDYDSYEEDNDYDFTENVPHLSSNEDDQLPQEYDEETDSLEDYISLEDNPCSKEGICSSSNDTISLREKLQQDLEASYSDPLPSRIKYRLKRKPSIYATRKPITDIGIPDIYEREVEVRVVPKDKSPPSVDNKKTVSEAKKSPPEGVISDHRKFLPSTSQKFIPLGAIYRSALEGREGSDDIQSSSDASTGSKKSDSQLSAPNGGLRKHLPFRRPFTFKAKRVNSESKSIDQYLDDDKNDVHSQGLSTLEKITLNKTPGVAIEYPPIFYSQNDENKHGQLKRPFRRRPGKRRRKNRRRPPLQEVPKSSEFDKNSKTPHEGGDDKSSLSYHHQNPAKSGQVIPNDNYLPPKEEQPQHFLAQPQSEGYKDLRENSIYIQNNANHLTNPSAIYVTASEFQLIDQPLVNYAPPSRNYVTLESSTTPKYSVSTSYSGSKSKVSGWLPNMQRNNKNPTPPPGYVPETTIQRAILKQKHDFKIIQSVESPKISFESPTKKFVSSCNTCQAKVTEVKYRMPAQKYELPQNEFQPQNKAINNVLPISQTYETPKNEYLPPSNKPLLPIKSFVPSQKYEPPNNEYAPPKQNYKIPSQSYEVPQKEFIPPIDSYHTSQNYKTPSQIYETPQNEYLPPSRSRIVDQKYYFPSVKSHAVNENYKPLVQTYEAPKNSYLPTKPHISAQTYNVPSQSYEVPKYEYLPPSKAHEVSPDYKVPSQTYEVPPVKPKEIIQSYKVPLQIYETPKNEYVPPTKSHKVAQSYKVPLQTYETPQNEYLPPTKYHEIVQNYKVPPQTYETPKNEYLPPTNFPEVVGSYKIPSQTYEVPKNEYLLPDKTVISSQVYSIPAQSYELPKHDYAIPDIEIYQLRTKNHEKAKEARKEPHDNEYFLQPVENYQGQNYKIPSQRFEAPILEYIPPDNTAPISIILHKEVSVPSKAYTPPQIVYATPITAKPYSGTSKDKDDEPKVTTKRPNYNLRAIGDTKELKTVVSTKAKQTHRRPSAGRRPSQHYDADFNYYDGDYIDPHSQIDLNSNYDYFYDDDQLPTSKLNLRQHHMIDYNFDIKENDILEYGYIIGIPGIAGIDYPILKYIPLTTFRCHLVADYPGYYADMEAGCQVFHVCHRNGRQDSFLCPNGTIFNQKYFVCDWWYNFSCEDAAFFYPVNAAIGQPDDSHSIKEFQLNQYRSQGSRGSKKKSSSIYRHRKRTSILDKRRKRPYRLKRRYSIMGAMSSPVYL